MRSYILSLQCCVLRSDCSIFYTLKYFTSVYCEYKLFYVNTGILRIMILESMTTHQKDLQMQQGMKLESQPESQSGSLSILLYLFKRRMKSGATDHKAIDTLRENTQSSFQQPEYLMTTVTNIISFQTVSRTFLMRDFRST